MNDLISRQKAIETALNYFVEFLGGALHENAQKELITRFRRLLSVQPEREKGKWVGCDDDRLKTMCKCSECGAMIDINEKYRNFFCYHCGADMREPEDIPIEYFESGGR